MTYGADALAPGFSLERHRHEHGYATVVLGGAFVEASFAGRAAVRAGDVLLHADFDCHANWSRGGHPLEILRLPWPYSGPEGRFVVADADELARIAERDPVEAAEVLHDQLEVAPPRALDWPEGLAGALVRDTSLSLRAWARARGLAPAMVSRGFRQAFGVSPKRFRLEVRARRAWNTVMGSDAALTAIAHDLAFADLAHMSRAIAAFTGRPPSAWRQLRSSRTAGGAASSCWR